MHQLEYNEATILLTKIYFHLQIQLYKIHPSYIDRRISTNFSNAYYIIFHVVLLSVVVYIKNARKVYMNVYRGKNI